MIGLTLLVKSSRGREFYATSIRNVTIIFVVAVGICIRGGKKKRRQVRHGESVVWRAAARLRSSGAADTPNPKGFARPVATATENIRVN